MITTKSLINPQSCEFVKAFLYEKSCQKISYNKMLESYKGTFGYKENMNIDISEIRRQLEPIKKLIQKLGKSNPTRKEEFLSWFAVTKWETIKQSEKEKHCVPLLSMFVKAFISSEHDACFTSASKFTQLQFLKKTPIDLVFL